MRGWQGWDRSGPEEGSTGTCKWGQYLGGEGLSPFFPGNFKICSTDGGPGKKKSRKQRHQENELYEGGRPPVRVPRSENQWGDPLLSASLSAFVLENEPQTEVGLGFDLQ